MGLGDGGLDQNVSDRTVLVYVLGEIPDREAALRDLFGALKPGGHLLVEEMVADPHIQTQSTVRRPSHTAGFVEPEVYGNRFFYTMILAKPSGGCPPES